MLSKWVMTESWFPRPCKSSNKDRQMKPFRSARLYNVSSENQIHVMKMRLPKFLYSKSGKTPRWEIYHAEMSIYHRIATTQNHATPDNSISGSSVLWPTTYCRWASFRTCSKVFLLSKQLEEVPWRCRYHWGGTKKFGASPRLVNDTQEMSKWMSFRRVHSPLTFTLRNVSIPGCCTRENCTAVRAFGFDHGTWTFTLVS